jgi:Ca-activated chloride channel family protein
MVTPLVFGLSMKMESSGFKIEKIYGSPEANQSTGELMKVNTLFASDKKDEQTRGGIIVLKLKKISDDNSIKFSISYEDRAGKKFSDETSTKFPAMSDDFYGNNGLRKAILLVRYANLIKTWLGNEKSSDDNVTVGNKEGETISFGGYKYTLNKWERQSETLYVPREYKKLFSAFKTYFESEMTTIGDTTLQKEADLLGKLSK